MIVTCDKCGKDFYVQKAQGETKQIDGIEVRHIYIQCPTCLTKYTVQYETPSTKALQEQINKRISELPNFKNNPKKLESARHNIAKKQKRLKKECTILEKKYSKYF